jgi:predicted LPLAT superfamily acyltransferase
MLRDAAWRIKGLGTRWQLGFAHALIRFAGRRGGYALADLVSLYYTLARPEVRARSRPYLTRRFPGHGGARRLLDAFRLNRTFGRLMVDHAAMRFLGGGEFRTSLRSRPELEALLAEGRGLIILTAHVGAWQLGMANLASLGRPMAILARFDAGDAGSPFHVFTGDKAACRILDPAGFLGAVPEMMGALQRGEVLGIMGDRAWGARTGTVAVPFLGGDVRLPFLPYKLASATGAPVAVLLPIKPAPDQYEMLLAAVIRVPPGLGRDPRAYAPYAGAFAGALETFLAESPYHFFNFFDMWQGEEAP